MADNSALNLWHKILTIKDSYSPHKLQDLWEQRVEEILGNLEARIIRMFPGEENVTAEKLYGGHSSDCIRKMMEQHDSRLLVRLQKQGFFTATDREQWQAHLSDKDTDMQRYKARFAKDMLRDRNKKLDNLTEKAYAWEKGEIFLKKVNPATAASDLSASGVYNLFFCYCMDDPASLKDQFGDLMLANLGLCSYSDAKTIKHTDKTGRLLQNRFVDIKEPEPLSAYDPDGLRRLVAEMAYALDRCESPSYAGRTMCPELAEEYKSRMMMQDDGFCLSKNRFAGFLLTEGTRCCHIIDGKQVQVIYKKNIFEILESIPIKMPYHEEIWQKITGKMENRNESHE